MKLNVAYVTMYYYPEITASLHLTQDLVHDLSKEDFNVNIITATPSRNISSEMRENYKKIKFEKIKNTNIAVYRIRLMHETKRVVQRVFRYIVYSIKVFFKLLNTESDVIVVGSTPPLILANACLMVSKIKKIPVILRLQDMFPETAIKSGRLSNKGVIKICEWFEKRLYNNVSAIVTIGNDMAQKVLEKVSNKDKIFIIPNWIDDDKVKEVSFEQNKFLRSFNINGKDEFRVLFAGNLGMAQDINIIVDAAVKLKDYEDIKFLIVGEGVQKKDTQKEVERKGLNNVCLYPMQPQELVPDVYSAGDVGLVTLKKGIIGNAIPSKTMSIMACNRPVIATVDKNSDYYNFINDEEVGIAVDAEDTDKFTEAILELYNDREKTKTFGNNARKYIEKNLSRKKLTLKYADILKKMVTNKCGGI